MKKLLSILLALVLIASLAGCAGTSEPSAAPVAAQPTAKAEDASKTPETPQAETPDKPITIGIAVNALDEYQTEWYGLVEKYAQEAGATLLMTNAEGKVDKQLADIETLIVKKPDVIIIRAVDSNGLAPAVDACVEAGIPVIDSDFIINSDKYTLRLTSGKQFENGKLQADWLENWMANNPDEKLNIGYLWGVQGVSGATDRFLGLKESLVDKHKDDGKVALLAEKVANWSATEAMAITEDWLQAYPEMNCIVAMSDEMAIGAINVLKAANADFSKFLVLGIDGSPNGQQCIKDGTMAMTAYTSKRASAQATVEYAIKLAKGETLEKDIDLGSKTMFSMDKTTIDEILAADQ